MRFIEFGLFEGYKEVTQKFSQDNDPAAVKDVITTYRDLVNRNQVQGNERNIDWWGKQGWGQFEKFVTAKSQQSSQNQQKKRSKTGKSYNLAETNEWLVVIPLDKDASCFHGKGTDWCTTKPAHDYFEQYFRDNSITLIYFLHKQTGKKWAAAVHLDTDHIEWFDINDREINIRTFSSQSGISVETAQKYIDMVLDKSSDASKKAGSAREIMVKDLQTLEQLLDDFQDAGGGKRSVEIETLLLKTKHKELLLKYIRLLSKGPIEFDQNMQTLIATQAGFGLKKIANLTEKTVRIALKNSPDALDWIIDAAPEMTAEIFTQDPSTIPDIHEVRRIEDIPPRFQEIFINAAGIWAVAFGNDLDPKLKEKANASLKKWFKDNPEIVAVVTEPGLTDLKWMDELTQEKNQAAVDRFGGDAYEVMTRDLKILTPNDM